MPRHKPAAGATSPQRLRRSIAIGAARLMADGGITDHGQAKRKAARQLGAGEGEALPTNSEIDAELVAYQALFHDDEEHSARQRALRQVAFDVMTLLADFRPYLTGAVLDGIAGSYTPVQIELFADSSKDVEIHLLAHQIPYSVEEMQRRGPDAPETRLTLDWDGATVQLLVFPLAAERSQPRHPAAGRQRARAAAVAALLGDSV